MIKNYLVMAWRTLRIHRTTGAINIIGLAIGMGVAMLIGLWVWDEVRFDTYDPHYQRVAQVMQNTTYNGDIQTSQAIPIPLGEALRKTYGAYFKRVVLSSWSQDAVTGVGEKKLVVTGNYMEPGGPQLFGLTMVEGSMDGLKDPSSILISQWLADAIFGKTDPLNKTLQLNDTANFTVAGVYQDPPRNSMLGESGVDFLAPWAYYLRGISAVRRTSWGRSFNQCFVELADRVDMSTGSRGIRDAKLAHVNADRLALKPTLFLHPMSKWHLYSEFNNGRVSGGRIEYVWLFGVIGAFVLLLACINFMNLSTARSEKRAKEVGIRKAVGSLRGQLIGQFYTESLLYALLAFALALLAVKLVLPYFNALSGKQLGILWDKPVFWAAVLAFTLATGLIAGSYPALYLSSFRPVKVLKGVFKVGKYAAAPRRVLVVLQFTVSVTLIIGTVVVFQQIQFARDRPVGYSMEGLVNAYLPTAALHDHFEALRTDLLKSGAVTEIAQSTSPAWNSNDNTSGVSWKGMDPQLAVDFANTGVTAAYGSVVGWQFVGGRDFIPGMATDSNAVVLNEAAVKYMRLKDPVGQTIKFKDSVKTVIGVIRDMVVGSPFDPVKQTVYYLADARQFLAIRINPQRGAHEAMDVIKQISKTYEPGTPINFQFVDTVYANKFRAEERVGTLAGFFAILAIFISCLGLFGMATFMAEQRVKEIGVRKVLGATVLHLWGLLSREFVYLVGVSLIIAIPVAYYFMHGWLQHYTYRVTLSWWMFAGAGLAALAIALLTVSYQGVRAARANPVKALRTE
jgi:putative ABC transport system permease protein